MLTRFFTPAVLLVVLASPAFSGEHRFHRPSVLGAPFELTVNAESRSVAAKAEEAALAEIDRLSAIFSRHDDNSELMRWQSAPAGQAKAPSRELTRVLRRSEFWRTATRGAFDIRSAAFSGMWEKAAREQKLPGAADRQQVLAKLQAAPIEWKGETALAGELPLSLDALAKGAIIDAALKVATAVPGVNGCIVNIGGDLRASESGVRIAIANAFDPAGKPLDVFTTKGPCAVAASGGYHRFHLIKGRKYSHIIDPRTGMPASGIAGATVIARTAEDADALATASCVMSPAATLELVNRLPGVECILQTSTGDVVTSNGWPGSRKTAQFVAANAEEADGFRVAFTLKKSSRGRYRRPYVAVWLEDTDRFPVRTGLLWLQVEQPGPRWHRDLTRWYRGERTRKLVEKKSMIDTMATATRGPGEYTAAFAATNNNGKPLPDGTYTLCIEVAREHGTYQIIRETFDFKKDKSIETKSLKGNVELGGVSFEYKSGNAVE